MDTGNNPSLSTWEINVKFLTAITALETTVANLAENVKKLDSRLDNHTNSDGSLRSEFNTFRVQHEMQLTQISSTLGEIKKHIQEHCDEISTKASSSIGDKINVVLDRVITIEQTRAKEEAERKAKAEAEEKQKQKEKEDYQKALDTFTKRNSLVNTIQQIATLIAGFIIAKYFAK